MRFTLYISLHSARQSAVMVSVEQGRGRVARGPVHNVCLAQPRQDRPGGLYAGSPCLSEPPGDARAVGPTGRCPVGALGIIFARRK